MLLLGFDLPLIAFLSFSQSLLPTYLGLPQLLLEVLVEVPQLLVQVILQVPSLFLVGFPGLLQP